ncbi:MAG: 30S ribosomal protein S17 [Promethearchaeota archaeon]
MKNTRNIGIKLDIYPEQVCDDKHCPFHGRISVRGKILEGVVENVKRQKTIKVYREYLFKVKKYKRYERRHSSLSVHCPPCIPVKEGDVVLFMETRKIAKTVSFVVIENRTTALERSKEQEEATV